MAISDTGRPAANSNLLLTASSDNQRNIGIERSMREVFERRLSLIDFCNTRAQSYTGARSFRTPRNLTTVTTDKAWDGSTAPDPTATGSFEQDEITWPTTRMLTQGKAIQQDIVEGLYDPTILLGDAIARQLLVDVDNDVYALMKAINVSAVVRTYTDKSDTTNQYNTPLGTAGSNFLGARGKRTGNDLGLLDFLNEMAVELSRHNVGLYGGEQTVPWNIIWGPEVHAEYNRALMAKGINVDRLTTQGLQFQPQVQSQTIFNVYVSNSFVQEDVTTATGRFAAQSSAATKKTHPIAFVRPGWATFGVRDRAVVTQEPFTPANVSHEWKVHYTSQMLLAADDVRDIWFGGILAE